MQKGVNPSHSVASPPFNQYIGQTMIKKTPFILLLILIPFLQFSCEKNKTTDPPATKIQLITAKVGPVSLLSSSPLVPSGEPIVLGFNTPTDPNSNEEIRLFDENGDLKTIAYQNLDNNKIIRITPQSAFSEGEQFRLSISNQFKGAQGESFDGIELAFEIEKEPLEILAITADGLPLDNDDRNLDIPLTLVFEVDLSHDVPVQILEDNIVLVGPVNYELNIQKIQDRKYSLTPIETLKDFSKINLLFPPGLGTDINRPFETVSYQLYTKLDTTPDFPVISDDELLALIQSQTFKYFWGFWASCQRYGQRTQQ